MSFYLGIDPGLSGAWALLNRHGEFVAADDLPIIRDQSTAWIDGPALADAIRMHLILSPPGRAIVERVKAMPKQGVSSTFTFGCAFGSVLPTLQRSEEHTSELQSH